MAETGEVVVFNVDYRLAPEAKCPENIKDFYSVLKYVIDNSSTLGVDPARVAIWGESGGGYLTAGTPAPTPVHLHLHLHLKLHLPLHLQLNTHQHLAHTFVCSYPGLCVMLAQNDEAHLVKQQTHGVPLQCQFTVNAL